MVDDPENQTEAVRRAAARRADDLVLKYRLKNLMATDPVMKWDAEKTAAIEEYLREHPLGYGRDSIPEWRLRKLIQEAGRDYDRNMAKQGEQR